MSRQPGHTAAKSGVPLPTKPRQADLRWPDQIAEARRRLAYNGWTDAEADDYLDWLAVVKRVGRLIPYLNGIDVGDLAERRSELPDMLWQLQRANRPHNAA